MKKEFTTVKCKNCGCIMKEISRERTIVEPDFDDITEGQLADYEAAELSGEYGDWAETIVTYICDNCKASLILEID